MKSTIASMLVLSTLVCSGFCSQAQASQPHPWYCGNVWYKGTVNFVATTNKFTYSLITSSSGGPAGSSNPTMTINVGVKKSAALTATATLGVSAQVTASATVGGTIGYEISTTVNKDFFWAPGTMWTGAVYWKYHEMSGTSSRVDWSDGNSCFSSCNNISHTHNGTWSAKRPIGLHWTANPAEA